MDRRRRARVVAAWLIVATACMWTVMVAVMLFTSWLLPLWLLPGGMVTLFLAAVVLHAADRHTTR